MRLRLVLLVSGFVLSCCFLRQHTSARTLPLHLQKTHLPKIIWQMLVQNEETFFNASGARRFLQQYGSITPKDTFVHDVAPPAADLFSEPLGRKKRRRRPLQERSQCMQLLPQDMSIGHPPHAQFVSSFCLGIVLPDQAVCPAPNKFLKRCQQKKPLRRHPNARGIDDVEYTFYAPDEAGALDEQEKQLHDWLRTLEDDLACAEKRFNAALSKYCTLRHGNDFVKAPGDPKSFYRLDSIESENDAVRCSSEDLNISVMDYIEGVTTRSHLSPAAQEEAIVSFVERSGWQSPSDVLEEEQASFGRTLSSSDDSYFEDF